MKRCPICKSINGEIYIKVKKWEICRCLTCDNLFIVLVSNRRISRKDFYDEGYVNAYLSRELELKNRFKEHLARIEIFKYGGRLLDIGCGLGYFLEVAEKSKKYLWDTSGLEVNRALAFYARKHLKGTIHIGQMFHTPFKDNSFDCITCFDVLEHDFNFKKNLKEIERVLKNNGIFVLQAPNYRSLMAYLTRKKWDWWAPPDHVLHFSFNFLVNYFENNNFEILEKFTYEKPKDFLLNIRGIIGKNYLIKTLFYLSIPLLLFLERISWCANLGALSFIIIRKK